MATVIFDSVLIGAGDLADTVRAYETLLGRAVLDCAGVPRFQLERGAIEFETGESGLRSVRFAPEPKGLDAGVAGETFHGITVRVDAMRDPPDMAPGGGDAIQAIDHVVINSSNLDRAIGLWRDRLGVRLALDREFPARGLRLLFFRSGGITLEFAGPLQPASDNAEPDRLYGLAYRVADLESCRSRLLRTGVGISEARPGQKRGTIVATVRSHTAGVPTLLIQESSAGGLPAQPSDE